MSSFYFDNLNSSTELLSLWHSILHKCICSEGEFARTSAIWLCWLSNLLWHIVPDEVALTACLILVYHTCFTYVCWMTLHSCIPSSLRIRTTSLRRYFVIAAKNPSYWIINIRLYEQSHLVYILEYDRCVIPNGNINFIYLCVFGRDKWFAAKPRSP